MIKRAMVSNREPTSRPVGERSRDEAGGDGADHGSHASENAYSGDLEEIVEVREYRNGGNEEEDGK